MGNRPSDSQISRSPLIALALVFRGIARWWLGVDGWRQDLEDAVAIGRTADPITHPAVVSWKYLDAIPHGVLQADDTAVRELERALQIAEASGEDTLVGNREIHAWSCAPGCETGPKIGGVVSKTAGGGPRPMPPAEIHADSICPSLTCARGGSESGSGDYVEAIPAMRKALDILFREGQVVPGIWGSAVLADGLLTRGADGDIADASASSTDLATLPDDVGGVVRDVWLLRLRALMALAHDDETVYRDHRDRYRVMATSFGFEGHMEWAAAMP